MLTGAVNMWNRVRTPETVRDAMGRILLSKGQEGASNLRGMDDLLSRINAESAAMAERSGAFYGLGTGLLGGGPTSGGGLLNP